MVPNPHFSHHPRRFVFPSNIHCFQKWWFFKWEYSLFQCAFANSQLNDILWISVDYAANVLGIQHTVLGSGGSCSSESPIDKDALEEFNTDVLVKRSELGQVWVIRHSLCPTLLVRALNLRMESCLCKTWPKLTIQKK